MAIAWPAMGRETLVFGFPIHLPGHRNGELNSPLAKLLQQFHQSTKITSDDGRTKCPRQYRQGSLRHSPSHSGGESHQFWKSWNSKWECHHRGSRTSQLQKENYYCILLLVIYMSTQKEQGMLEHWPGSRGGPAHWREKLDYSFYRKARTL